MEYLLIYGARLQKLVVVRRGLSRVIGYICQLPVVFVIRAIMRSVAKSDRDLTHIRYCEPQPFSIHDYKSQSFFVEPTQPRGSTSKAQGRGGPRAHPVFTDDVIKRSVRSCWSRSRKRPRLFASMMTPAIVNFVVEKTFRRPRI